MKVLITGGSRGIGKAVCEKFLSEGYEVCSPSREELDLSNNLSIEKFINNNKNVKFDSIINNAGINPLDFIEDISDKDFDMAMQINVKAPLKIIQGFIQGMKESNYGRIVNISSIWGIISKEKRTTYSISKYGINGLTNSLAVECGIHNILVNSICPGFVNTELTKKNVPEKEANAIKQLIPLNRFAEPTEIAETVYFFGSQKNTYITGQKIIIDGGYTSK